MPFSTAVVRCELAFQKGWPDDHVTEDEAKRGQDLSLRFLRQRSEQYLTSVHTAAHFLRQE